MDTESKKNKTTTIKTQIEPFDENFVYTNEYFKYFNKKYNLMSNNNVVKIYEDILCGKKTT